MIKKISIIALVLLLAGIVGSLLTFRSVNVLEPVSEEKVINNQNITAIDVDTDNSDVEIVPTKKSQTKIEVSGKTTGDYKHELTAEVEGTILNIKLKDQRQKFFYFNFNAFAESFRLKIYLPEKEYASLKINSSNGRIHLEQLKVKDLFAESNNGRIELKKIASTSVNVKTDNGRITLDYVDGKIKGKSSNGRISVLTKDLDRPIELDTDNGRIEIQTEKEPTNTTFDVDTDNGSIDILDKYNGNAVIGNGENLIRLSTNNGSISVTK